MILSTPTPECLPKEIVALSLGERGEKGANQLWNSLPGIYKQCAICYTDFWSAYDIIFPDCRHRSLGKETGLTAHIERLNNTLRQKISPSLRKTLSFSKKLENHLGTTCVFHS